jgi:hypothetical protein
MVDSSLPVWTRREGALAILGLKPEGSHDDNEHVLQTEASLQRHLDAGKGIAYYRNEDLGHHMIGDVVALTFGTPEAQFEPEQFPDGPPKQMPDGLQRARTGGINWRYVLCAVTYALPDIVEHHDDDEDDEPTTQLWLAVDIAAEGPEAVTVIERFLNFSDKVVRWRVVNPANDADAATFNEVRDRLKMVFEEQGPMEELPVGRILGHIHSEEGLEVIADSIVGHVENHHPGMDRLDADWREHPKMAHEADHNAHDFKRVEQDTGVPPESPAYQGKIGEHHRPSRLHRAVRGSEDPRRQPGRSRRAAQPAA